MTPLDFRLTAPAIFRLLALECSILAATVNEVYTRFLPEQLVSTQVLSNASLTAQAAALHEKFLTLLSGELASSEGGQLFTVTVRQSRLYSIGHTNAFVSIVPGSDQYQVLNNFYPIHDNASYVNVSRPYRTNIAQNFRKSCVTHVVKSYEKIRATIVFPSQFTTELDKSRRILRI